MSCGGNLGKYRWFYTGNQVGDLNFVGDFNFVAGGPAGSGISAGVLVRRFFQKEISRNLWEYPTARLSQELLNASFPFIELQWIADIQISNKAYFRVSDRNIYVQDEDGAPRFYEARVQKGPSINITLGEWLSPNFEIGDFKLDMNNRDGFFNDYLPQGDKYLQWIGAKVSIKVGFGEKLSNYYEVFRGFVSNKQGVTGTHETISIKCYDRTFEDEVLIPITTFDRTNYPNVDTEIIGKSLPLIYGDWTTEVGDFGEVPAYCANAYDSLTTVFEWKISENSLQSIGNIYLHRGDNVVGKDGPILLNDSAITKQPDLGRILIPSTIPCLSRVFILLDRARAGAGSGVNTILSESPSLDFVKAGIRAGDVVLKDGDPTSYTILSVGAGVITTSSGTFAPQDNYRVITDKYTFKKGDKISVICRGKDLRVMSTTRLSNAGLIGADPRGLSIGLDNSYWTIDNTAKKIYKASFNNQLLKTINFSDIDPSIDYISSIDIAFDETLWILDRDNSKIYRYIVKDNAVGLSFTTIAVTGIGTLLSNPSGICIDDANILTIVNNDTGQFYRFSPFDPNLTVINTFNRSAFNSLAIDIVDISADVNLNQLVIIDRATNKVYRLNETTGALISGSDFNVSGLASNLTFPNGVAYYIDGTLFILNRNDNTIYNYNEFAGSSDNIGFICRDLLQKYSGKTTFDFDLLWNETARNDLAQFKARIYIDNKVTAITHINKLLQSFNTNCYVRLQKYALFHITFDNFRTDGDTIREGDIKLSSFAPTKEYNQYFNVAIAEYKKLPFSDSTIVSDVYASPSGIKLAGRAITKQLDLSPLYDRDDMDRLIPLFVRLASAEPEFINMTVAFRFLFVQPNTFFNVNFFDYEPGKKSGRRYNNIPAFVRKIDLDLSTMTIKLKLWSLGTTQFGNYLPPGTIAGGENDQIILTNLGTPAWISPVGTITSSSGSNLIIEDVDAINAQNRSAPATGLAWIAGYKLAIVNAATQEIEETVEIQSVVNQTISLTSAPTITILPSVKNSAGFYVSGHYIKYAQYDDVVDNQTKQYGFFTRPQEGYPATTIAEIEDQRSGNHNFPDSRLPFLLHPSGYTPSI
jgi:hypothetical protein